MSGTRKLLAGIATDLDLVISKTGSATKALRDHAAAAKETKADRETAIKDAERMTKAQLAGQEAMTKLFSQAQDLAKQFPLVEQYLAGIVTATDVTNALGATVAKVLPSESDIQARIRGWIEACKDGVDEVANLENLLAEQNDRFAQMFIQKIKLFEQGKITIQQLIELGQQYSETLPDGSATGQIIDEIVDALRGKP